VTKPFFTGSFNASSTMDNNHPKYWRPRKIKPQKSFLLSSKRNSNTFAFIEKEKALASIEKQRSISALTEKPQKETPRQHTRETAYRRR
jgi:hypothetical protein